MRARSIAAVFVAVLLVGSLAGCSKKDSGSDEATGEKTEETDESTTTTADDSSSNDDAGNTGSDSSGDDANADDVTGLLGDCGQAYLAFSTMMASTGAFMGGEVTDEQMKELDDQASELQDSVPEDLRDDLQTFVDAYKDLGDAISEHGLLSDEVQDATENLDSGEAKEASENIEEYFNSCQS